MHCKGINWEGTFLRMRGQIKANQFHQVFLLPNDSHLNGSPSSSTLIASWPINLHLAIILREKIRIDKIHIYQELSWIHLLLGGWLSSKLEVALELAWHTCGDMGEGEEKEQGGNICLSSGAEDSISPCHERV